MSASPHFDASFSFEKSIHILSELVTNLLGNDHELVHRLSDGDWASALSFPLRADEGMCGRDYWRLAQALAFFSKNASLPLHIDTRSVALNKFLDAEMKCRETNNRFRNRSLPFSQGGLDAGLIFSVQRKIADILGPFPGPMAFSYAFGPGANVGVSRFTSVRRKLSATPTCSTAAFKYIKYLQEVSPWWTNLGQPEIVDYGRYTTVPKNAKTDRSILVEPLINSYLQKGVGSYIRERLRRRGINLNDQSINQEWARIGSLDGSIATLDLEAASDTISREVVAELLPLDWWLFLNDIRSQYCRLPDGRTLYLQKFSSMGNGFTFELESLIFYSILSVVCEGDPRISVYGDDLIVPTSMVTSVEYALSHFGFTVNREKSFSTGAFRESCGSDYLGGCMVRPCYVKGLLSIKDLYRLHNYFTRKGEVDLAGLLLKHIPHRFRLFGPDGYGDGHLLGSWRPCRSRQARSAGWGGCYFRTFTCKPLIRRETLSGDYAAFLYSIQNKASSPWLPSDSLVSETMYHERGGRGYKVARLYVLEQP